MNRANVADVAKNDRNKYAESVQRRLRNMTQYRNQNWRMSYSFVKSGQRNVILQRKATYLVCTYKDKVQSTCPADVKMLKHSVRRDSKTADEDSKLEDVHWDESEASLDACSSDLAGERSKLSTWNEYKKLVEASRLRPKADPSFKPALTRVTSLPKIRIDRGQFKLRQHTSTHCQIRRSIIRTEVQKKILVADMNYVQFRNFKLKKMYKKKIKLRNVSDVPARFQMGARPYRSKFRVAMKPVVENRSVIAPGMYLQLIVSFRCDDIDTPEEMLILNVQHGTSLIIRMHGYKDPPVLLGTCLAKEIVFRYSDTNTKLLDQTWYPEMATSFDSFGSTVSSSSESLFSYQSEDKDFVSTTFDCKKGFVGEEVYMPVKLKNVGGAGRFFVMSETDWFSMDIMDIRDTNILRLPCFTVQPAYFSLKMHEEMILRMYFKPECYGIHVEKLYILCDNCTLLATEIIGDGLVYEPNFIRLSKQFEKIWPFKRNIDERAKYYVNLSTNTPDGIGQCIIIVNNVSEISMHFHWKKRNVQTKANKISEENYFPLELLHIKPERGIFAPTSSHYFTLTVEYKDLQPNYYFTVLQLYVEDIPLEAVSQKASLQIHQCSTKRRKCSASADIWVADVEVWLQYMTNDEGETRRTTEEILERIIGGPADDAYIWQDSYEEEEEEGQIPDEIEDSVEYKSPCQLVPDELFSHYDVVNLGQFEQLGWERVISMGIVRPTRSLFVGIEETYILTLKNLAEKSLDYSWGEANGLDSTKMKLCVCPEKGEVSAGNAQRMEITITPIEEGIVQSLFVPCFVGDSRKVIVLGIECSVEPLYVTFSFPLDDEEQLSQLKSNFVRVEWRVDSLKLALDTAGKSRNHSFSEEELARRIRASEVDVFRESRIIAVLYLIGRDIGTKLRKMKILDKYRRREERELMNTNLDQGLLLKDASAGPSRRQVDVEEWDEQSSPSTRSSEIIRMNDLTVENESYSKDVASSGNVVPFSDKLLPFPTQPIVIEFLNLPLRTVRKKTFVVKNETAIPTNFHLRVKNFYPVACSCKWKTQENRIKSIYERVFSHRKYVREQTLDKLKQPGAGVVIYVDPLNSDIGPFQAIPVNIYVFADTWGIYVDELEINILGLPRYSIGICLHVAGSPISLSISDRNEFNIPVIRYGIEAIGSRLQDRKVLLKNTSVLPIIIDWHTFVNKPIIETLPFNVVFDLRTPFTDHLASNLRAGEGMDDSRIRLGDRKNSSLSKGSHVCDSTDVGDSNYGGSPFVDTSWAPSDETLNNTEVSLECSDDNPRSSSKMNYDSDEIYVIESNVTDRSDSEEKKEIELNISIIPYHGSIDTRICSVTPKEMFIPPKHSASLNINVQLDKYKAINKTKEPVEGEFVCKILGFLRISPSDTYKDNCYVRHSGTYLPPIEIDVTANITKPRLDFNISKFDRTFVCYASDVARSNKKRLELSKTFFLYNTESKAIEIALETSDPFYVKSVSIYADANRCKPGIMCINPNGCAEVEVVCVVHTELIQTLMYTSSTQDLHDSKITLKEMLHIKHSDKQHQNVELILQIWLPVLKLSSYTLDFGLVYIGDTKKLTLTVKNFSKSPLNFRVNKKFKNKDFVIDRRDKILPSQYGSGEWSFTHTVLFQPKCPGHAAETLEIVTDIPYNTEECQLYGEGTLDEKYHIPGV